MPGSDTGTPLMPWRESGRRAGPAEALDLAAPASPRLVAEILGAFDQACQEGQFDAATELLRIAEDVFARLAPRLPPLAGRAAPEQLAEARERLRAALDQQPDPRSSDPRQCVRPGPLGAGRDAGRPGTPRLKP